MSNVQLTSAMQNIIPQNVQIFNPNVQLPTWRSYDSEDESNRSAPVLLQNKGEPRRSGSGFPAYDRRIADRAFLRLSMTDKRDRVAVLARG